MVKNIKQIAQLTGFSPITVSRAISNPEKVALKTREKILKVVKDLGYEKNQFAVNLRQQDSNVIGLIVADILNPFQAKIIKSVQEVVYKNGYNLIVCNSNESQIMEEKGLTVLRGNRLKGLIVIPAPGKRDTLSMVNNIPIVQIDRTTDTQKVIQVLLNNDMGIHFAVEHLRKLNHRNIACIVGNTEILSFRERINSFKNYAKNGYNGISIILKNDKDTSSEAFEAFKKLMQEPYNKPTAVIAGNNDIGKGIIKAITELKIKLPDDLSLICFDDPDWAALYPCPITVISQPAYEMGRFAANMLLEQIKKPDLKTTQSIRFDPIFVLRNSTGYLKT